MDDEVIKNEDFQQYLNFNETLYKFMNTGKCEEYLKERARFPKPNDFMLTKRRSYKNYQWALEYHSLDRYVIEVFTDKEAEELFEQLEKLMQEDWIHREWGSYF